VNVRAEVQVGRGCPDPTAVLVDDTAGIRDMVSQILRDEGYAVVTAADGAETLDAVERFHPRLVLLDMRMPALNGWEFALALNDREIDVPVVVMTVAQHAKAWATEISAPLTFSRSRSGSRSWSILL
jgi:CheY-like chemotaxis protein